MKQRETAVIILRLAINSHIRLIRKLSGNCGILFLNMRNVCMISLINLERFSFDLEIMTH